MPTLTPETAAARRDNLISAAMRCFARHGYRGTSVRDIAREAGVTTGAIYSHFGGKDDLLAAVGARFEALRAEAFREPEADAPVADALEDSLTTLTDYLDQESARDWLFSDIVIMAEALSVPDLNELLIRTDLQHFRAFEALLRRSPRWREGVDPSMLARVVTGSLFGMLILKAFHSQLDRRGYIACLRALVAAAIEDRSGGRGTDLSEGGTDE